MNKLLSLFLCLIAFNSFANSTCTYHVDVEVVYYEGYPFRVGDELRKIMKSKGYEEKYPSEVNVEIKVKTVEGRFFQHAQTQILLLLGETREMVAKAQGSNRCLTQLCSVWDVQKSILSAIKDFPDQIPECR